MLVRGTDDTPNAQFPLRAIRNKIVGKDDALTASDPGLNWDEIKETLTINFADKRDQHALLIELHSLVTKKLPVDELYKRTVQGGNGPY
ncbi:GL26931 [Drosophila persimilis]|uniref:GL26931 n=1 Tax=Drosophila persimilis TaxID=7234 RepID=B4HC76_DROPE|nr:GL26931 [Drosophila persimilis]